MLDTRVFTLGVLPDEDGVNIFVRSLEALDRHARTNVGEEVEGPTERQVQRNVALTNCCIVNGSSTQAYSGDTDWGWRAGLILCVT